MRFSVAFWHTFRGTGADPFGAPTKVWPWEDGTNSLAMAKRRSMMITWPNFVFSSSLLGYVSVCLLEELTFVSTGIAVRAHFEFIEKLGVDKWCFHDRDIAPDGKTLEVCPSVVLYTSVNTWTQKYNQHGLLLLSRKLFSICSLTIGSVVVSISYVSCVLTVNQSGRVI